MSTFNIKNRRTKNYQPDGTKIYNTMNSTSLESNYKNTNSRVNSRANPNVVSGCGTQCCFNNILITDISQVSWEASGQFNSGTNISIGTIIKVSTDGATKEDVGTIYDVIYPSTNSCIPLNGCDCSGNFPLSLRLIIKSTNPSCKIINNDIRYVHFYNGATETGVATSEGSNLVIVKESPKYSGSSRGRAPYRAPLAGYRKTLECCENVRNLSTNTVYKDSYALNSVNNPSVCYDKRIRSGLQESKETNASYSHSYSQYNKNRQMNTYERGLEHNAIAPRENCSDQLTYRKSGGTSCVSCGANINMPKHSTTIWKPNNKKFKKQGAVSSGSRMERLKLDALRAANSKCVKGRRCRTVGCEQIPTGPYFAGKPRFTGWKQPNLARCSECK